MKIGERTVPGTSPSGEPVSMSYVNVHEGTSDNGGYQSRGSRGCITVNPCDAETFFDNFDWSGDNGKSGTSTGKIIISRNDDNKLKSEIQSRILYQNNPLKKIKPLSINQ